jgi:Cys-rich four helix bundle protein (predicted Tat secretion target)
MERRDVLAALGAVGTMALASGSANANQSAEHHHHESSAPKMRPLITATANCVSTGEACLAHCLTLLGQGDKAMAECAASVNQMLAVCGALQSLAAQQSRLAPALAKVALNACAECEKNCKKHADKHAECKACLDACVECGKQCKALVG